MPSPAAAWTRDRCYDHGSWRDNDSCAVRTTCTVGPAMKARTAAARDLDDRVSLDSVGCKGRGLCGAS